MNMKTLIICGPSGSGKSTLVKKLVEKYPEKYVKALQYTTRPRREGEAADEYKFVDKEEFRQAHSSLVGVTHINGNSYGSVLNTNERRIQIFILNQEGVNDFMHIASCLGDSLKIRCLGISRDIEECVKARPSRSREYIAEEFKVLLEADQIYSNIWPTLNDDVIADLDKTVDIVFGE